MSKQAPTSPDHAANPDGRPPRLAPLRRRIDPRGNGNDQRPSARSDPRTHGWRLAPIRRPAGPHDEIPLLDPAFDDVDEMPVALLRLPPSTIRDASGEGAPRA